MKGRTGRDQLQPLSSADSTEIAGVIARIAVKNSAAPIMPMTSTAKFGRPMARCTSASSDRVPPSPSLSARRDQDVFHRHDQHQRPDDQRQDAQHILALDAAMAGAGGMHRLAEGIKRRGADIAIDHANGGQRTATAARALMGFADRGGVMVGVWLGDQGIWLSRLAI